ncbi:hypothetical protein FIBSPDRAFT_950078 [Athelia psychrophila]|uniref:Uncharacterized protein n=1 Tax=Athelia psychrophila TaxID=1759441 RepID=A0A166P2Z6_9AGAM|nr:hypothetical protein FIBSPDRAFT_950078 [Fibularhizoctonia sp. CBS 109695]
MLYRRLFWLIVASGLGMRSLAVPGPSAVHIGPRCSFGLFHFGTARACFPLPPVLMLASRFLPPFVLVAPSRPARSLLLPALRARCFLPALRARCFLPALCARCSLPPTAPSCPSRPLLPPALRAHRSFPFCALTASTRTPHTASVIPDHKKGFLKE